MCLRTKALRHTGVEQLSRNTLAKPYIPLARIYIRVQNSYKDKDLKMNIIL